MAAGELTTDEASAAAFGGNYRDLHPAQSNYSAHDVQRDDGHARQCPQIKRYEQSEFFAEAVAYQQVTHGLEFADILRLVAELRPPPVTSTA
jgi:hypothetical protein